MRARVEGIQKFIDAHARFEQVNRQRRTFSEIPAGPIRFLKVFSYPFNHILIVSEGEDYGNLEKTVGKNDGLYAGQA